MVAGGGASNVAEGTRPVAPRRERIQKWTGTAAKPGNGVGQPPNPNSANMGRGTGVGASAAHLAASPTTAA